MKAVNLIPSEQRGSAKTAAAGPAAPSPEGSPFGAYVILGVLAFVVAAAALYVLAGNSITERKAELARVEADAALVKQQAATLQAFADFKTLSEARVTTVRGIANSRFSWQRALDDVSRALPSDVYLSSLNGTTSGEGGGSGLRGAISAPAIELTGCTRNQASIARLMSHLRGVRGVTRVSLSKSEVPDAANTAPALGATPIGADGKVPLTATEPCPKGSPPDFEMVVFFERAAISAGAAPNAVAGPGGASGGTTGPTGPAGAAGPTGASGATTPASTTTSTTP